MKNPTMLFALIALAAGIMSSGFIGIDSTNGETLSSPLAHELQEQLEGLLPSLAHTDPGITVALRGSCPATVASSFSGSPALISGRPSITRCMTMCFGVHGSDATVVALSRTSATEIAGGAHGFISTVAATVPELRFSQAQNSPLAESLAGQIDTPGLVRAFATHRRLGFGKVRAEELLFNATITSAKPVLSNNMRNDYVFAKTLASQISEPFRACHLNSPWKEWLSDRTKNIQQHHMLQMFC